MVGVQGFEPWTPWSQTRCASQTAPHSENKQDRLLPTVLHVSANMFDRLEVIVVHRLIRLFTVTFLLSSILKLVRPDGLEPPTFCV
jgi:hypothetical protein